MRGGVWKAGGKGAGSVAGLKRTRIKRLLSLFSGRERVLLLLSVLLLTSVLEAAQHLVLFFQSLSTTPVALSCSSASAPLSPLTANLPSSSPPSGGVDNGGRAEKDRLVVGREPAKSRGLPAEDRKSVERLVGGRAYVVGKCGAVGEDVSLGGRGRHKGAVGEGAEEGGRARNDADWETLARSRPPWGLAVQLNSSAHNIIRLLEQELAWWNPGKDLANPASPAGGWRRPPPSSRGFPLSLTLTQSSQGRYQYVLSQGVDSGR